MAKSKTSKSTQEKIRDDRKCKFLIELMRTASAKKACETLRIDRSTPYRWEREDPAFKEAWDESRMVVACMWEEEAARRAYEGTLKPVFYMGAECGHIREYSDTLMMFLLNGAMPEKYKRNSKVEHTGKDGGPIQTEIKEVLDYVQKQPEVGRDFDDE